MQELQTCYTGKSEADERVKLFPWGGHLLWELVWMKVSVQEPAPGS